MLLGLFTRHLGPVDKDNGWGGECGRWGMGRAPESNGGEMGTTVIEPQLKKKRMYRSEGR